MSKKLSFVQGLFLSSLFTPWLVSASLIEVLPVSYTVAEATDCGSYCYHDETGSQLLDGQYGSNNWAEDLGNGNAYEWLGWRDSSVSIDFNFGQLVQVNQIDIGTVQDNLNDVVFPSVYLSTSADGITWNSDFASLFVPEDNANNATHGTLSLDGFNETSQYFRVQLRFSVDGPWTFTDEVDFLQEANAIPNPHILAIMGLGLMIFITKGRNRNRIIKKDQG